MSKASAAVAPGSFVLNVPTTDLTVLTQVLEAIAPYLGAATVTAAPSIGDLADTWTVITVIFTGARRLDELAIMVASVASDHVSGTSVAWIGADAVMRTAAPGRWALVRLARMRMGLGRW